MRWHYLGIVPDIGAHIFIDRADLEVAHGTMLDRDTGIATPPGDTPDDRCCLPGCTAHVGPDTPSEWFCCETHQGIWLRQHQGTTNPYGDLGEAMDASVD